MYLKISNGTNVNQYKSLFSTAKNDNALIEIDTTQYDFMTMGTVRNAVKLQKTKEQAENMGNGTGEPLYEDKLSWYGIDITNNPDAHKVIVPLNDAVKEKIFQNVKKSFQETARKPKNDVSTIEEFYDFCDTTVSTLIGMDKLKTA